MLIINIIFFKFYLYKKLIKEFYLLNIPIFSNFHFFMQFYFNRLYVFFDIYLRIKSSIKHIGLVIS